MNIIETADKTVRGPWCFELDIERPSPSRLLHKFFPEEIKPSHYTGDVLISLHGGISVAISPEEAETLADILRDFAGRARQRQGALAPEKETR